jgi:hypothetical protein
MRNIAAKTPPILIGRCGCNHSKMLEMRLFCTTQTTTLHALFALSNCAVKYNWIDIKGLPQQTA